jgi:bifunctional non-homologous end joining protein LigD
MSDQLSLRLPAEVPRLPASIRPMLAQPADRPFDAPTHLFEPRWAGRRALAFLEPDAARGGGPASDVRILDAAGRDLAPLLPELHDLRARIDAISAILDGELVVVDRAGRADRAALEARLAGKSPRGRDASVVRSVVGYLVFDLLYVDGRPLLGQPLERRRATLRRLLLPGDVVVAVPAIAGEGVALHRAVSAQGIAGIAARERRGPYLPGVRSRLWLTIEAERVGATADARPAPSEPEAEGDAEAPFAAPTLALFQRLPFDDER